MRRGNARRAHFRRVQRDALVAPRVEIVGDEIQRVGEHRLVDDAIVARVADVAVGRDRIARDSLEREPRLEQRAVEVVHAAARRVAVQLAHAQHQLARERRVGQLHGGNRPRERVPVANRHAVPIPRRARANEIVLRVVERATHGVEVREQQVAVDQPVDRLVARRLLERLDRVARRREQLAPSAPAEDDGGGLGAVALRADGDEERDLLARTRARS